MKLLVCLALVAAVSAVELNLFNEEAFARGLVNGEPTALNLFEDGQCGGSAAVAIKISDQHQDCDAETVVLKQGAQEYHFDSEECAPGSGMTLWEFHAQGDADCSGSAQASARVPHTEHCLSFQFELTVGDKSIQSAQLQF